MFQCARRSRGWGARGTAGLCLATGLLAPVGAMARGVLDPRGPVGAAERLILLNAIGIMLVVVVPVISLTLAFAWWYRASNRRAVARPDFTYSGKIELVVWSIPAMVVILLGVVGWIGAHQLDPRVPLAGGVAPLRVGVVSFDWKWLFIYPDGKVAMVNRLVVPAGVPVAFELTSATVMTAFFVPQLGSQIYTMPGMVTHLNLQADRPGDYPGLASHFSGDAFSDMHFLVHAVPPAEFAAWLARVGRDAPPLDAGVYAGLRHPGTVATPQSFRVTDAALFDRIVQDSTMSPPAGASR